MSPIADAHGAAVLAYAAILSPGHARDITIRAFRRVQDELGDVDASDPVAVAALVRKNARLAAAASAPTATAEQTARAEHELARTDLGPAPAWLAGELAPAEAAAVPAAAAAAQPGATSEWLVAEVEQVQPVRPAPATGGWEPATAPAATTVTVPAPRSGRPRRLRALGMVLAVLLALVAGGVALSAALKDDVGGGSPARPADTARAAAAKAQDARLARQRRARMKRAEAARARQVRAERRRVREARRRRAARRAIVRARRQAARATPTAPASSAPAVPTARRPAPATSSPPPRPTAAPRPQRTAAPAPPPSNPDPPGRLPPSEE